MELAVPYYAVLIAAVVSFILGGLWYSQVLFGNVWMKLMGMDMKKMQTPEMCKQAQKSMAAGFVFQLLTAFILAHFISFLPEKNLMNYLQLAGWIWLGFVLPVCAGSILWESRPFKLFLINASYQLCQLLVIAAVLSIF